MATPTSTEDIEEEEIVIALFVSGDCVGRFLKILEGNKEKHQRTREEKMKHGAEIQDSTQKEKPSRRRWTFHHTLPVWSLT